MFLNVVVAMAECGAQNIYLLQNPAPPPPPPITGTYGPHTQPMRAREIWILVMETEKTCRFGVLDVNANIGP
jgi:hypothetical protein